MQAIEKEMSLSQIVIDNPLAAQVFHRFNMDYCCGGGQSLEAVCDKKNVNPSDVIAQISDLEKEKYSDFTVNEETRASVVIDHILKRFHEVHKREIPQLLFLSEKVARVHGPSHPELIELQQLVQNLIADIEPHMEKEERVLFPMILELESALSNNLERPQFHCGSLENPIFQMESEHVEVGAILEAIRAASSDFKLPEGACNSYRAYYAALEKLEFDLHLHIHYENNVLHPMAKKM